MHNIVCKTCKKSKPCTNYPKTGLDKSGLQTYRKHCKFCYNSKWTYKISKNIARRTTPVKSDVTMKFLEDLFKKQKGKCYWLGIDLDVTGVDKLRKPSLDRLDNTRGYFQDNVVITTLFANTGRRDATTNEMHTFIKTYLTQHNGSNKK
jgi:hypothetical protein